MPGASAKDGGGSEQATHRDFDRDDFPTVPNINNKWLPLVRAPSSSSRVRPVSAAASCPTR
jgi:hypothetical protein